MAAEHLSQRAGQLRAQQTYWEGVRRQANATLEERANNQLQDTDPNRGMYTDNEQEQLKSQMASAIFHLQEISQELERIRQLEEAEAREEAQQREQTQRQEALNDTLNREDELKETVAKEGREKAEALRKDEQIKAEALEKERQEKEFFEKKESERLEAIAKEEREKQEAIAKEEREKQEAFEREQREKEEREKQEAQQKQQESDLGILLEGVAEINNEWQYIQDQIASEWDYVDKQIQEEMEYNVNQALEAVAEAGFEIGIAIANPVSQKETVEFLEEQKHELKNLISDEVFQAAPAEKKEEWLEHEIKEQMRGEEEKFGERKDDWDNRKQLQEGMAELHESLRESVKQELEIQNKVNAEVEELKRVEAVTKERMERANLEKEVLEEKTRQAEELAKKLEAQLREQAEKERQAIWEREQRLMQEIEAQRREEAAREEARRREEAARAMRDTFGF